MSDTFSHFDKRVQRISKKNRKLARGYVNYIDPTGIIRQRPIRKLGVIPFKGLTMIGLSLVGFKGLLIAHQGPEQYQDRLALLADGSVFERAAAWVMQIEPISLKAAALLAPLV